MKHSLIRVFAALTLVTVTGCTTFIDVIRENPGRGKYRGGKTIYVGWLDIPEGMWRTLGYSSQRRWKTEIRGNNSGIKQYLREQLPGRIIKGSASKPGKGDLYIKLQYRGFVRNYSQVTGGMDEMKIGVQIIDIRSGRTRYNALLRVKSGGTFPRNWKGSTLDGRLDNIMYNLAGFIAQKV
ncbi:MAG TPA: hypothetical protein PK926_17360 [Spirochaetota bacterium]|nr:hypothetical protein [Spirochaetota bacterium]HPI90313.1 hypothetical protein [Spirochaetota bacterium]HPR49727.1 hypothetical protein [Spirochaetota bacterium]